MEDNAPKENPPADFNKLDLTQLQGFSFGTQWTQEKSSPADRRDHGEGADRPHREDRREGGGGPGGPDRRDRRTFRRPAAPGGGDAPAGAPAGGAAPAGERREYSGGPRRDGPGGNFRGGPRRDAPGGDRGGPRYSQGGYAQGGRPPERGPYESPYYTATFYPEDTSFNTLVQTIRKSCRTVELFEIARTVVAKTDRFVVVVAHKTPGNEYDRRGPEQGGARTAEGAARPPAAEAPVKARPLFYISIPDGIPFESDEAAVSHVLSKHLDKFFETAEAEVEPPKGNFQVINKCSVTGELLGPPNYHRYNQIIQQHYAAKLASRMSFEAFRGRIETVRDPEVVAQWLAKMKKTTRYTWKAGGPKAAAPAASAAASAPATSQPAEPAESSAPADAAAPVDSTASSEPAVPTAAATSETPAPAAAATPTAPSTPTFDTFEDARMHLLTNARDKVVRTSEAARFHGKVAETMPPGEIRQAVEGALERQRRFPLDTANALRGRLRREHFTIFKKGSKGVSYVCAVKRKFRIPGQTFADSIGALIGFIEANPMIRASELGTKFLGLAQLAPAKIADAPAPAADPAAAAGTPAAESPKAEPNLSVDERARLSRMQGDLMWLVREGYVTEFIDGRLFAPPPMVEARKKEVEAEEHDPENFPEVPAAETPVRPAAAGAADESSGEASSPPAEDTAAEPAAAEESAPASSESGSAEPPSPETQPSPAADPESKSSAS